MRLNSIMADGAFLPGIRKQKSETTSGLGSETSSGALPSVNYCKFSFPLQRIHGGGFPQKQSLPAPSRTSPPQKTFHGRTPACPRPGHDPQNERPPKRGGRIVRHHRPTPQPPRQHDGSRENGLSSGWPRASFARDDRPWEGDFCLSCDKKAGGPRNPLIFGDLAPPLLLK